MGPTQILQNNVPNLRYLKIITGAQFLLPSKITYSRVLGIRARASLSGRVHYCTYHINVFIHIKNIFSKIDNI